MSPLPILLLLGILMIASVQGYVDYDASPVYNGRRYFMKKVHEPFNLAKMNGRCKEYGGYLVQIDDKAELKFVKGFILGAGGYGPFFTGINDEESEGQFYTYNDKKPVKYLKWKWSQPDNWYNEDCVNIDIGMFTTGLNDMACGKSGRYICEVPLVRLFW
ncbi:collectin-12 [Plakobranchus ocellatus]|uniref:Collectin-12 n=1 Tax=Plakobranchus ocellatus TaxID=259542 RepID=A0AAV4CAQ0_9GAST|nr:collectin-12 [Plakobranchus ocellatus]